MDQEGSSDPPHGTHPAKVSRTLSGASAADLPLVVWLRGDEPHCAEFSLDADEVMGRLGIRRSRLTQISGKELRVGRTRRGRYVVPVFREADVEEYLGWTRASASHLKSSAVLTDAAAALEAKGQELTATLEAAPREMVDRISAELRRAVAALSGALQIGIGGLEQEGRVDGAQARHEARLILSRLAELAGALAEVARVGTEQRAAAAAAALEMAELAAVARLTRAEVAALQAEVGGARVAQAQLEDEVRTALAAVSRSLAAQVDAAAGMVEPLAAQAAALARLAEPLAAQAAAFALLVDMGEAPAAAGTSVAGPEQRPRRRPPTGAARRWRIRATILGLAVAALGFVPGRAKAAPAAEIGFDFLSSSTSTKTDAATINGSDIELSGSYLFILKQIHVAPEL